MLGPNLAGTTGGDLGGSGSTHRRGMLGAVLAVVLFTSGGAFAQANLVANPSFELCSSIPMSPGFLNLASYWTSSTNACPDYFHFSATGMSSVNVPGNAFGSQDPDIGQSAYAGFTARTTTPYREYLETPLSSPLAAGKAYVVSFHVSLADASQWAVDKIGAYLSVGPVGPVNTDYVLPVVPQVVNAANTFINDTQAWTLITGQYVAAGGEDHLVIGNFCDDSSTTPLAVQGGTFSGAYYYVDDVSVTPVLPLCATPPSDMVAWWRLDETSGASVKDDAGGLNGATFPDAIGSPGGPKSSAAWPPPYFQQGVVGDSLFFCCGHRVEVQNALALNPAAGDFTIDAWVVFSYAGHNSESTILSKGAGLGEMYKLVINEDDSGAMALSCTMVGASGSCTVSSPISPYTWHHVAATLERQTGSQILSLYIDGAYAGVVVGADIGGIANAAPLLLGGIGPSGSGIALDEVEIFSRALSSQEVQSIFNASSSGKCTCANAPPGMVSWWPADGNADDIVGGNHGTPQGTATFAPGMVAEAFSFPAAGGYVEVLDDVSLDCTPGCDFSIDAWILVQTPSASAAAQVLPIVDKRYLPAGVNAPQSTGYMLFLFNGALACQLGDGTFFNYIGAGPDLRDGAFHHVAVTVDRDSPTGGNLYVDGAVVRIFNPTNRQGDLSNGQSLLIGRHSGDPGVSFVGLIDEVEFFDRALSASEVQAIRAAGLAGKCKPDLGDAPDSTNHASAAMEAYPTVGVYPSVPAYYPTAYDPSPTGSEPLGPAHRNARGLAWLGAEVSPEGNADIGWDGDGAALGNNIQPISGMDDMDGHDDGVTSVPLLNCAMTSFAFSATNARDTAMPVYINVWFDWACDGDWDDVASCPWDPTEVVPEWAVKNYVVSLSPGFNAALVTPLFMSMLPPPGHTIWMRITLTVVPVDAINNGGPFWSPADRGRGGSGPFGGYCFGETEDYELGPY